ncbi:MAG: alpha/beta fold hydrolase [Myxococcota bacterium]
MIVRTADGWSLGVTVHPAQVRAGAGGGRSGPRTVAVALHAMMADARSLDRPAGNGMASALARHGIEVWRADLRGHGGSAPTPRDGGSWTYDDVVRGDLPALVAAARQAADRVVVVGHSLGGHTAAAAAADGAPIDALVLLATNVWMPSHEPSLRRRIRKAASMAAFDGITRWAGRFPSRRLRFGPADEAAPYVRDLCGFWWADAWRAGDGTDWFDGLARYPGRVLAVAGAGDALLAHPEAARRFADGFRRGAVTFWLAERGRLGLDWDPDHPGLACDPRSAPLWDRIGGWIADPA